MIGRFKDAFAAFLDEGYSVEDIRDIIDAAKVEYDRAHYDMITNEIACIFDDYGYSIPTGAIAKFVHESINVVKCTEEKCEEPTKCSCETKNEAKKRIL